MLRSVKKEEKEERECKGVRDGGDGRQEGRQNRDPGGERT
jgi:hypothetical protein